MSRFILARALSASLAAVVVLGTSVNPAIAGSKSWADANGGDWSTGADWSPIGIPTALDAVFIGNIFSVQNEWVDLDVDATIASLSITDGMMLDSDGSRLIVNGDTLVSGQNQVGNVMCSAW